MASRGVGGGGHATPRHLATIATIRAKQSSKQEARAASTAAVAACAAASAKDNNHKGRDVHALLWSKKREREGVGKRRSG